MDEFVFYVEDDVDEGKNHDAEVEDHDDEEEKENEGDLDATVAAVALSRAEKRKEKNRRRNLCGGLRRRAGVFFGDAECGRNGLAFDDGDGYGRRK